MAFLRLLLGAILLLSLTDIGLGTTRTRTDEITSRDDTMVTFPGGIVVPTTPLSGTNDSTFFSSTTYSATITALNNLEGVTTPATLKYERAGNYVHVFGQVTLNPQYATTTRFQISLPIPRSVVFSGTSGAFGSAGLPATVTNGTCAPVSGRRSVQCAYTAVSATADLVNVNFTYALTGN